MPLTNAEKQRLYRERHLSFSEDHEPLCRLQAFVQPYTFNNVTRISKVSGLTKREVIEKAINELAKRLGCNHAWRCMIFLLVCCFNYFSCLFIT